ncbi:MAG: ABC transporter ATP-binding protein [Nitriliruptor sp.]|nr:MAG: ABC transporter ATP-binding protein [Nitriliruptor sp.]
MTTPSVPALSVRGLEVIYSGAVLGLAGVSIDVPPGQIVAVLGANGAGKTTLVRAITGLLFNHNGKVRDGQIQYGGQDLISASAATTVKSGICQVPEGRMLFPRLTVEENLRCGAATRRDKGINDDLQEMYERFPRLGERNRQLAGYLSGGEQQMVAIGRALMARPKLLVCDELSLGLAPLIVRDLFDQLEELARERGTSVLVIEQNARVALSKADYAYVIETGRVVVEGAASKLQQDEFVQEFYLGGGGDSREAYDRIARRYRQRGVA